MEVSEELNKILEKMIVKNHISGSGHIIDGNNIYFFLF